MKEQKSHHKNNARLKLNGSFVTRKATSANHDKKVLIELLFFSIIKLRLPPRVGALLAVVASGGGLLFGYDIGVVSGALHQLSERFSLSCPMQEMVVSSMLFGALFGSLFGGYFIDKFGRKPTIIFSSVLYLVGGIVLSASQFYRDIIVGRVIVGIAMALASSSECVYVSELAPQAIRGTLVSLNEFGITIGILLSYLVNVAFANNMLNGWRYMFGLSTIGAVLVFFCILFLPESPRYLLMKGKTMSAKSALMSIRLHNNADQTDLIDKEFENMEKNAITAASCSALFSRNLFYPYVTAFGLVMLQQLSGEPNVLFYANTILTGVGFQNDIVASLGTVSLGIAKVVATILCLLLVDKYGRRKFLLIGCSVMFISILCVSAITFHFNIEGEDLCRESNVSSSNYDNHTSTVIAPLVAATSTEASKWFALILLLVFIAAYSISFGPVTWIVLSEIFPRELRGRLFSLATSLNWTMNLIISATFLGFAESAGGLGWPFMTSAIFCVISIVFVYIIVPETKGKSLEEVTALMNRGIQCKSCWYSLFRRNESGTPLISDVSV